MFGDRRLSELEPVDQLPDAELGRSQLVENPAPRRLGEHRKCIRAHALEYA
jgi:hypothetical protein